MFGGNLGYLICIPFAALLRLFYQMTNSYGLSLIFFTIILKLIMLPFQMKSKKSMVRMGKLNGRMEEIKKMYPKNQQKQNEEIQKLYAEEGVSPMSGCLWSFLPLFIILPLYSIIRMPITRFMMLAEEVVTNAKDALGAAGIQLTMNSAYEQIEIVEKVSSQLKEFAANVEGWMNIDFSFCGVNLASRAGDAFKAITAGGGFNWANIGLVLLPIICAALSLVQSLVSMKGQAQNATSKSMMLTMPLMSLWFCWIMPAALGVYWLAQSIFQIIQEATLNKVFTKKIEAEEEERERKREAARKFRQEEARKRQAEQAELSRRQEKERKAQKAAEDAARKANKSVTTEAGRIGDRPYARGRSFSEDHYNN